MGGSGHDPPPPNCPSSELAERSGLQSPAVSARAGEFAFSVGLGCAFAVGLALRLAIIAGPLGEIDADEAIVGLMARHIAFLGELPVFYWGQPYLGSLEAFSAAALFRLFDSSTLLLKLVPTTYSLGFLALSAVIARRLFGIPAALATAAYLAVPPVMWAVWSTKARGGYAELLCLGQGLLLVSLLLARSPSRGLALLWGVLAGLAFWTHALAVVYLVPAVVFLFLARRRWTTPEMGLAVVGGVLGMAPLILENLGDGFLTLAALLQPADSPLDRAAQFVRFFRVGVPVLLGLGQPTTSQTMLDADWLKRPAGHLWVAGLALLMLAGVLVVYAPSLRRLIACGAVRPSEPALLLMLAIMVPPVVAMTRFGFLVSEPRYALPLYSTAPLLAGALWGARLPAGRADLIRWGVVVGVLGFNLWSLLSTDVRLWRPEDAPESTAATRADLVHYLVAADRHQMYTDYWIGYPVMFETRETVLAYVISGGFNRYVPPADNVQRTPNPAWVFTPDTDAEVAFVDQLVVVGGQAQVADIAVYRVYTDVQPLAALRPSGLISNPALGPPP
jgi:Dolichyl-phosphate-mannose-protein mannosyltransferase